MTLLNKEEIRRQFRKYRRDVTLKARHEASIKAAEFFTQSLFFAKSHSIACYFPNDDEFETRALIEAIWRADKNCYLPILEKKELQFALYSSDTELKPNRYNILEPQHTSIITKTDLDMVLMPLVAFDLKGNRVGMGGGYYDRTFAFLSDSPIKKPALIGLGFEGQCMEQLPHDIWDVKLQGVITEKKFHSF